MKMRYAFLFGIVPFVLSACGASLESKVDLTVAMQPTDIVVSQENGLQQKALITWEVKNNSSIDLVQSDYELTLGYGRVNDLSTVLMTKIEKDILSGNSVKGEYEYYFRAIQGMDGNYELRFDLSEKNQDGSVSRVKEAKIPFAQKLEK